MAYIPISSVGNIRNFKNKLTVKEFDYMQSKEQGKSIHTIIPCYDLSVKGYIGVPRAYALDKFPSVNFIDRTSAGEVSNTFLSYDGAIQPRNPQQEEFMNALANVCTKEGITDCIVNAKTGSGKTVTDLWLSIKLGVPTLVVVPNNALKEMWLGSVKDKNGMRYFFGEDFVDKYVGIAQQDKCDYKGKLVVIALLPSLARRDYGSGFYRYFGKLTIDEVHKCPTPVLSKALYKLSMRTRLGYTATNRKGNTRKICDMHFGLPKVESKQTVMKPCVYLCQYNAKVKLWGSTDSQWLTSLATNADRNKYIAKLVYMRGYKRNRNIVIFSDKVKQLQLIHDLLISCGIPHTELGLYVGELYERNSKGGFYNSKIKVDKAELARISSESTIILATYAIFDTGVDIARLDMGVEASPSRVDLTQAIGRVVREKEGKPQPEWYSIVDHLYYEDIFLDGRGSVKKTYSFLLNKAKNRLRSFRKQGAVIRKVKWG